MQTELDRRFLLGGLAGAAGISALSAMAKAGPLNPAAGPVASTGKPLAEIEPRTAVNAANTPGQSGFTYAINASGSYYLTADLVSSGGANGILINAPRVTLDLNGFSIVNGGTGTVGILLAAAETTAAIRNGTVTGWSNIGVAYSSGVGIATIFENLIFKNCGRGIRVAGPIHVRHCTARACATIGFEATSPNALFESCVAEACPGIGFYLNPNSAAATCTANACGTGFYAGDGSRLTDCTAAGCAVLGFDAGSSVLIHRCIARSNGTTNVAGNGNIRAGVRAAIIDSVVESGFFRGIQTSHASLISGCVVTSGSGTGIETGDGCTIDRCNISNNGVNGLQVTSNCRVTNNVIDYHQAAGAAAVRCTGGYNTVEQNQLSRAPIGVDMTNTGNNAALNNRVSCATPFAVNAGGNWYPQIPVANVGSATSSFVNVIY
jgi:hypothetical protein